MKEKDLHYAAMKRILLASMILLPVVPFILALWIGHYHFTSALENSTIASITRIVEDHRHMIDSFLAERRNDLEFFDIHVVVIEQPIASALRKPNIEHLDI